YSALLVASAAPRRSLRVAGDGGWKAPGRPVPSSDTSGSRLRRHGHRRTESCAVPPHRSNAWRATHRIEGSSCDIGQCQSEYCDRSAEGQAPERVYRNCRKSESGTTEWKCHTPTPARLDV